MNSATVTDALERLAPPPHFVDDWGDVLRRAGEHTAERSVHARRQRLSRRRWLVAAVLAAVVLVPIAAATVAATNDWWFFAGHGPKPLTKPVVVKSGTWDGTDWELVAYRAAGQGICFTIAPSASATSDGLGAALACGGFSAAAPSGRPHGITYMSSSSPELPTYVAGPVIDTADEVAIYLANGDVLKTPAFDAPASLGAVRFYATQIPEPVTHPATGGGQSFVKELVGLDNGGRVVACLAISPASRC